MTYSLIPIQATGPNLDPNYGYLPAMTGISTNPTGLPASFGRFVFSVWLGFPQGYAGFAFSSGYGGLSIFVGLEIGATASYVYRVQISSEPSNAFITAPHTLGLQLAFQSADFATAPTGLHHVLVSVDLATQMAQVYINDVPLSLLPGGTIAGIVGAASFIYPGSHVSGTMAQDYVTFPGQGVQSWNASSFSNSTQQFFFGSFVQDLAAFTSADGYFEFQDTTLCIADVWFAVPAARYDLSVTSNRRFFIDGTGAAVDPGLNGQLPLSTPPAIYLTARDGNAADFYNNNGSGGAFISPFYPMGFGTCYSNTPPPPTETATIAELWFATTAAFVDLSVTANRRKFISDKGGACDLSANGATPFGATPPVYLTARGDPSTFYQNNGNGGAFVFTGTIDTAATEPPSVTTSAATASGGGALVLGVVGDYRNGNIYHLNPATLSDNGTQRRWMRRWRALPEADEGATRFSALVIDMETGNGVPDGTTAQMSLRWSDDGGKTWSDERIITVARRGQTLVPIKFNRLGSIRRNRGVDRLFELSSADPFMVAILGAEVDVS